MIPPLSTAQERRPSSVDSVGTKVPQYLFEFSQRDPIAGDRRRDLPTSKLEIIRGSDQIQSLGYFSNDDSQIRVSTQSLSYYFRFKSSDSARLFKELLEKGDSSLILLVDYWSDDVEYVAHGIRDVYPSAAYFWDDTVKELLNIGELIGPKRSLKDQSYWTQFMVTIFGRSYLNNVRLIQPSDVTRIKTQGI